MKIAAVLDVMNRYQSKVLIDGRVLASGNSGLEDIELVTRGKRTFVRLTLSNADVFLIGDSCPEQSRFHVIKQLLGDNKLRQLNLVCDMLRVSLNACDGCPKHPEKNPQQI
jgi:hypothetical protein